MAGLRRSKRLESCSQPDQDKVTKIAKTSKNQEKVVPEKNKKTGGSAMVEPSDPGVDRASLDDSSPNDASLNHAWLIEAWQKEQQLDEEHQNDPLWNEAQQKEKQANAELAQKRAEKLHKGLEDFRRALQREIGLGNQQFKLFKTWDSLHGCIMKFAEVAGFKGLPWDSLDEAAQQKFIGYSPHAQQLFETPRISQYMFVRWIWEIIDENFFSRKSQDIEWTSPYWEAQATMERILREKNFNYDGDRQTFQYPNWRYTTFECYYSLREVHEYEVRIGPGCVVKILKRALGQNFPENPDPFCKEMLSHLTKKVVIFEFMFDYGRSTLRHVFHDPKTIEAYGFPFSAKVEGFNGKVMRSAGDDDDATYECRPVDLVVSPMLVFYGHHSGFDYHIATVAFPMRVCVGYPGGFDQDEVIETEEDGEGDGEEEAKMIKEKEDGKGDEDEKKIEDEE